MKAGISRVGMEPEWIAKETEKSNMLIRAWMLQEQGDVDTALNLYVQVAEMEEELADYCLHIGLQEKAWHHQYAAASTWATAGELHRALQQCERMLNDTTLSSAMQKVVREYSDKLRDQRRQWVAFWRQLQNAQEPSDAEPTRPEKALSVG
ncbi:MAG TPA: hypothetical protein VKU00_06530 [Chthonomonadaceae bacterium]|nr:hypothetical protein [Chthonomonadaceae bacterium]